MDFVPVVIRLSVIAADAVDSHSTSDRWWREVNWIDDFADDERSGPAQLVDQFETQIAVFVVDLNLRDEAFSNDVRLPVAFDVRNIHKVKFFKVERFGHERSGALLFGRAPGRHNKHRGDEGGDSDESQRETRLDHQPAPLATRARSLRGRESLSLQARFN